jgi:signal transduction histidine kinase
MFHLSSKRKISIMILFAQTNNWRYMAIKKLEIALFNLISNAIKFTPMDGAVSSVLKIRLDM